MIGAITSNIPQSFVILLYVTAKVTFEVGYLLYIQLYIGNLLYTILAQLLLLCLAKSVILRGKLILSVVRPNAQPTV